MADIPIIHQKVGFVPIRIVEGNPILKQKLIQRVIVPQVETPKKVRNVTKKSALS